jgi:hypothetical protein
LILGQKVGSLIVFEGASQNSCSNILGELHSAEGFLDDVLERKESLESVRQGGVLGFESRQGDLCLQEGLPNKGQPQSIIIKPVGFALVQTREVGINEQIECEKRRQSRPN